MEFLGSLVVNKPLNILIVAALFFVGYLALQFAVAGEAKNAKAVLVVAIGWALYAAWEWLVTVKSPDANIRVDLLVIWPVLFALSMWGVIRAFKA